MCEGPAAARPQTFPSCQPLVQEEGTERAVIGLGSENRRFQCVAPPPNPQPPTPPGSSLGPDTDHTPEESIIRQRDSFWSPVSPQRAAFPRDKGERLLSSGLWTPSQNTSERIPRGRLRGVPETLALPAVGHAPSR